MKCLKVALNHALPKLLLEHRSLAKLKSTYTDKLPLMINPRTQRVHTSYHQAVTATGRLSSRDLTYKIFQLELKKVAGSAKPLSRVKATK